MAHIYMILLAVAFFARHTFTQYAFDCQISAPRACGSHFRMRFSTMRTLLPDMELLKESCGPVRAQLECINEHNKTCGTLGNAFHPIGDLDALENFLRDLCDENSSIHQGYARHVTCLNNKDSAIRDLLYETNLKMHMFWQHLRANSVGNAPEVQSILNCIQMKIWEREMVKVIASECGQEAGETAAEIISRVLNPDTNLCPSEDDETFKYYTDLYGEFHSKSLTPEDYLASLMVNEIDDQ